MSGVIDRPKLPPPAEDVVHAALSAATRLLPFLLSDPPQPPSCFPAELLSAPVRERQRWLGAEAGTRFTSPLFAPPAALGGKEEGEGEAREARTEQALEAFRWETERTSSSLQDDSAGGQRAISPLLLRHPPKFRQPEPGTLVCAVPLQQLSSSGAGTSALTLLVLREEDDGNDGEQEEEEGGSTLAGFKFLNLLPCPIDALPGVWAEAGASHSGGVGRLEAADDGTAAGAAGDDGAGAEYPADGDDFWDGFSDSGGSSSGDAVRGQGGKDKVDEAGGADSEDEYWAQYGEQEQEQDGDEDGPAAAVSLSVSGGGRLRAVSGQERAAGRSAPGHTSTGMAPPATAPPTAVAPTGGHAGAASASTSASGKEEQMAAQLEQTRALLRQAWDSTASLVPRTHPSPLEARRTLVFTLLADAMGGASSSSTMG
ncbi:hypothetical protein OC844_002708 [Tilletia horrida]|nr:hypothetical protein OC844_002708 [Tilletia horrida]